MVDGAECVVAGTGYTGQDGVELAVPAAHAVAVWDALLAEGIEPAGLGARDTLRLEAGFPLHGHELGRASRRSRPGSDGSSVGTRASSAAGPRSLPRRSAVSPASCEASARKGAARPAPSSRCSSTAPRSARSLAATSHRCSDTASPSRSCRPTWRTAPPSRSKARGEPLPWGEVVRLPFWRQDLDYS